ncbi:PEP-CTERM sorting domain-containing protein [Aureliella helgolandensis]|nr:PEP-CTERM sorting domain-containing protein [Aureliella helgolandensis]
MIDFETRPDGSTIGPDNSELGLNEAYTFDSGLEVTFGFDTSVTNSQRNNFTNDSVFSADEAAKFELSGGSDNGNGFLSSTASGQHDTGRDATAQEQLGDYFLRQGGGIENPKGTAFVIDYNQGVLALSGEIWDIDSTQKNNNQKYESWRVVAYGEDDSYVAHVDSPKGIHHSKNGSLDSLPWVFSVESSAKLIHQVVILYTGSATSVGLAFNNFNPTQAAPPVAPEPSSLMVFGMGALSCIRFRRR